MIATAFLHLTPDTTLTQITDAAMELEAGGVAAVALLDAADTGTATATHFESTTLAAAVAVRTSSIGIVASNSTLYGFPYHAARRLATIDHLSAGRSGWLLRTAPAPQEDAAYEWRSNAGRGEELHRSTEYAEIALELWDSWEAGSQWPDKSTGMFKNDNGIHPIDYRSTSFRVAGPLDVPPSPQRRPVLFAEISCPQEAILLVPYVDVAVIGATEEDSALALAETVHRIDPTTLVLVAGAVDGTAALLPSSSAFALVGAGNIAGVALHLVPGSACSVAQMLSVRTEAAHHAGTLADALGIGSDFAHGGYAA